MIWVLIFGVLLAGVVIGTVFGDDIRALRSIGIQEACWRFALWAHRKLAPAQGMHSAAVLSDLPRRKPLVNRQPWQTSDMPAIAVPAAQLALEAGDEPDEPQIARPYAPTNGQTVELYFTLPDAPAFGAGTCEADVLAAERQDAGLPG
jgi:hypothetical protein